MLEIIIGIVAGIMTVLFNEYRRYRINKARSINPPPPNVDTCKKCFFWRQFSRNYERQNGHSGMRDSQMIRHFQTKMPEPWGNEHD